jgi:hypothetical protein
MRGHNLLKMKYLNLYKCRCLTFLPALAAIAAFAGTTDPVQADSPGMSALDKLWDLPTLYKNNQNPFIEEFDFTGRLQVDYFNVESTRGSTEFFEIRRFRLGFDSWFANRHMELKVTLDTALLNYNAPSIFYNRFTDLFLNYHASDALNIRAGKFEPHFGYDREFSDVQQKFFERGILDDQVFNNLGNDYVTGASVLGRIHNWGYQAAAFSDNVDREFGQFNGGYSGLFELNYDFSKALGAAKALWAVDCMHMENNANSDVFNTMHNAAATYFDYQPGRFCLVAQAGYGNGTTAKGDLCALMLMPSYYVIRDKLEAVVRCQYAASDQSNGIALMNRQDKTVGSFTGDAYDSAYMGLNYYIYGQKCKLMLGGQSDNLTGGTGKQAGYRGWTMLAGLRMYW